MVMFVMVIAVMSISMGVAVQTASFQMQREKEAELIFRGQQFVEAIRLYKTKYGRYPMQLKEIYEAKPRVIRKKWKDPITDSEDWGLIFLGQDREARGQRGRQLAGPGQSGRNSRQGGSNPVETQTPFGSSGTGDSASDDIDPQTGLPRSSFGDAAANRKMGPIIGVHSKSTDEAIKIYEGHSTYSEWKFVYREEQQQGRGGNQQPQKPPVGWHPGDKFPGDRNQGQGSGPGTGPGSNPPPPIATVPRP